MATVYKVEVEIVSDWVWILFGLIMIWAALNWATFGETIPWLLSNLFILFYVIYIFFGKKTKKVGQWLDDKLN